jgi:IS5 family transposase
MLGKQSNHVGQPQCVTVEALVPANHVLRRLHAALDLGFVQEKVASVYSQFGRPSVDPELVVRMWILQHFYGFSERQLCDELTMHAGFRWFCGLSFADPVPDQSTLVKLRNEKWAKSNLWQEVLTETVRLCEAAGIARPGAGQRLGIDGTQINASAAIVSLEALPPELTVVEATEEGEDAEGGRVSSTAAPAEAPAPVWSTGSRHPSRPVLHVEAGGRRVPSGHGPHKSGDPEWHGERFSNATHRSTTDPEARLYRKGGGQEAKLRYLGHYLADVRCGVIYGAMATQATGTAEREAALTLLDGVAELPGELAADLGYRDGDFLAAVLGRGVQPLVPLQDEPLAAEPAWQRRASSPERQEQREAELAAARARNATRLAVQGRRGVAAQRQRTRLEHLFGEGKEHHGLGEAQGRGLTRVDQQVKLTASVQNLKRWACRRRRRAAQVQTARSAAIVRAMQHPGGPVGGTPRGFRTGSRPSRRRRTPARHATRESPACCFSCTQGHCLILRLLALFHHASNAGCRDGSRGFRRAASRPRSGPECGRRGRDGTQHCGTAGSRGHHRTAPAGRGARLKRWTEEQQIAGLWEATRRTSGRPDSDKWNPEGRAGHDTYGRCRMRL